jgi:hypothetical protein
MPVLAVYSITFSRYSAGYIRSHSINHIHIFTIMYAWRYQVLKNHKIPETTRTPTSARRGIKQRESKNTLKDMEGPVFAHIPPRPILSIDPMIPPRPEVKTAMPDLPPLLVRE